MQTVIGVGLVPFVLGLALTLTLRACLRQGAAWWATVVGLALAVGLFVYARYFTYHCDSRSPYSGCGDIDLSDLDYILPFLGFVLWLLGVGAAAGLSRLSRGDRPPQS